MAGVSRKPVKDRPMDFKGFLKDLNDWDLLGEKNQKTKGQATDGKKQIEVESFGKGYGDCDSKLEELMGSLWDTGNLDDGKGPPRKIAAREDKKKASAIAGTTASERGKHYLNYSDEISQFPSSYLSDEKLPDASSEKELGNEYFKQKKYLESIECYSRSIVLSPTAVAYANRAMAYIKIKRFEEAENDCTDALNLDDRYVKAYSRRATARKELGKFKASMEDAEFAIRIEPNNQELRKQYNEAKELLEKEMAKKNYVPSKSSSHVLKREDTTERAMKGVQNVHSVSSNRPVAAATSMQTSSVDSNGHSFGKPIIDINNVDSKCTSTRGETRGSINGSHGSAAMNSTDKSAKVLQGVGHRKQDLDASIQELASRAASRVAATARKNISAPKTAYEFEVSWRALSGDSEKQACLLKTILPATIPQLFKNALSAPMLIEIIKCTANIFKEDTEFAISILDNLTRVPRFDMIIMCLSPVDHAEIGHLWEQVFSANDIIAGHVELLGRLRSKFCYGGWQGHEHGSLGSSRWPK